MKGLLLIYGLTVVGAVGALRAPQIGLFVYIGFAVLRPQFLWGWAGDMDGLSQALGVAMLVGWAFKGFGDWRFASARPIVLSLLGFAAWSTLSALQAENGAVSYTNLVELSKIVFPFLVGVTMLQSDRDVRTLLWIVVAAQGYVSFEMNLSYLQGYNRAHAEGFGGMDNNCLGVALVTTFGAALALFLSSTRWIERAIVSAAALLILHTALLTFSRGALIGLLVVGALTVIIMPKRPRYVVVALAVLLLTIRLTGPELAARYQSAFVEQEELDTSATSRLDLWRDCLAVMVAQPFFGVGPSNWPEVAEQYGWPAGKQAHSVWMQTGAEVGVPGVLLLLSFYVLAMLKLRAVVRRERAGPNAARLAYALGLTVAIAGYVTSAQFVSLAGLEVPFYLVMTAVVLLRQSQTVPANRERAPAVVTSARPVRIGPPAARPQIG